MTTRNVRLTERQNRLVDALVAKGRYQNASEVMREGLRLLEEREAEEAATLSWFNEQIAVGVEQARRGEVAGNIDQVLDRIDDALEREDAKSG
jgi:antitoxin ParD1/3/4